MPWQIVYTIPLLCGLVSVWLSIPHERTPRRWLGVALLLLIAVLSSDVGLFVIFGLGLWFMFDARLRQIWELAPAAALRLAWFVTIGRGGLGDDGLSHATIGAVIPYTVTGITSGIGGLVGLGPSFGALVLAFALGCVYARRPHLNPAL
jgi:hypothetical protein